MPQILQSNDSAALNSPPKSEGRRIWYQVADDEGEDEASERLSLTFQGMGVEELTRKLEEETGIEGLVVCTRNPLNGKPYPIRLQLPPNNATLNVVLVLKSSKCEILGSLFTFSNSDSLVSCECCHICFSCFWSSACNSSLLIDLKLFLS